MESKFKIAAEILLGTIGGLMAITSPEQQALILVITAAVIIAFIFLWPDKEQKHLENLTDQIALLIQKLRQQKPSTTLTGNEILAKRIMETEEERFKKRIEAAEKMFPDIFDPDKPDPFSK